TILIDNYDSFVFNVYQFLSSEGANVLVFRNDQITLAQIKALNPVNIVVSPGPGKPCDAGISPEVIKEFAGKIPIFGVCLGEQSMYEVFGGVVTYAGEIVHGKTSEINHDGKGVYKGIPQRFNVTRYHSLAGDPKTLPEDLEMTSWTDNGLIMGVRHKKFTIEGVQYHPESVMSEHGHTMMRNFLKLRGGLWSDNVDSLNAETKTSTVPNGRPDEIQVLALTDSNSRDHILKSNQQSTILQQIHAQRLIDIKTAKSTPGKSEADLEALISLGLSPSLISFADRLRESKHSPAVMAEIKRASPSKGLIDIKAIAPKQALLYAQAGASVISVLTEPKWFKGTLDDLRSVRQAIDSLPNRPAVLRKDFIVDSYQILESRLAGADTILLIVAMLADDQLLDLIKYSRMLGMEPLVEVNNTNEMTRALKAGAKVIGVNNRNLHTFDVDMNTTSRLAEMVPNEVIVAALSGIWGRKDVEQYVKQGVGAVLVGEALMRSSDKKLFIEGLWGLDSASSSSNDNQPSAIPKKPLAKICGIKTVQAAVTAAEAGADLIGMIFVPNMKRTISIETAQTIVSTIKSKFHRPGHNLTLPSRSSDLDQWFSKSQEYLLNLLQYKKPLTVGVFMNQSATEILNVLKEVDLDVIQLHGEENLELARLLPKPVIKVFKSSVIESAKSSGNNVIKVQEGFYHFVLLDSGSGSGQVLDWKTLPTVQGDNQETVDIILAGGLNPQNVGTALTDTASGLLAVDVSSGVEEDGAKKDGLIREFVKIVKN
ncbi:indole-3-glycerol phosphate synthase-domain-containing protein, partial [Paraphysoderma sedebokerense]